MSMFGQRARVAAAQRRMSEARAAVVVPASSLLARGKQHPLLILGTAAGAGFAMGRMNVHPLRVPGLGSLLGGVMAEAAALGASLLASSAGDA